MSFILRHPTLAPSSYRSLHSSATGNCNFTVRKRGSQYGNRVRLEFGGTDGGVTLMSCTCGFTTRFKIPCCDIIAVGRGEQQMSRHSYQFGAARLDWRKEVQCR